MHAQVFEAEDLPPIIQRAISRLFHPAYFSELSSTERFAFAQLVRRVSATDSEEVFWCKRSNFAKLLGISEATVYRILQKLETCGLIRRCEQSRSATGALSVAALNLTDRALKLLGFDGASDASLFHYRPSHSEQETSRLASVKDLNQGTKKQSATQKHSDECFDSIPSELRPLVERGLSKAQVCMLMRLAREKATRLGDVLGVISPKVSTLQGRSLFAFLRGAIKLGRDWAALARSKREGEQQSAEAERNKASRDRLYADLAGRELIWRNAKVEICPSGQGFITLHSLSGSAPTATSPPGAPLGTAFWDDMLAEHEKRRA